MDQVENIFFKYGRTVLYITKVVTSSGLVRTGPVTVPGGYNSSTVFSAYPAWTIF